MISVEIWHADTVILYW